MQKESQSHPVELTLEDRKAAANAIINMLPVSIKQQIQIVTHRHGMCRKSQRATRALVHRGMKIVQGNAATIQARKDDKERRELALYRAIEKRMARGVDRPFPGMTVERYEALKKFYAQKLYAQKLYAQKLYAHVEEVYLDGDNLESVEGEEGY